MATRYQTIVSLIVSLSFPLQVLENIIQGKDGVIHTNGQTANEGRWHPTWLLIFDYVILRRYLDAGQVLVTKTVALNGEGG